MARKAFVVNEKVREQVRHLAGVGVRQDDIARIIGCAPKTLRKRCREDLDRGIAEANATVAGYLFAAARAGNIAAMIFWLRTRAHWRERAPADEPTSAAETQSNAEILLLPDNSRDRELTKALRDAQDKYFAENASGTSGGDPTPDLTRKAITRPIGDTSLFFGAMRIEMHWLATCRQATSKKSG